MLLPSASQFLTAATTLGICDATFAVTEEVRISSIDYEGATVTIRFPSIAALLYRLERASDLAAADWVPVRTDILGTGAVMAVTDAASGLSVTRFYRLRVIR